jgi:hypothetical protein
MPPQGARVAVNGYVVIGKRVTEAEILAGS